MGVEVLVIGNGGLYPLDSLAQQAAELKTALANCKVRLFKSALPAVNIFTPLSAIDAQQADYSGYTANGVTVTAAGDPYIDLETNSVMVALPSVQFNFATPEEGDPVTNQIGGAYVVDSGGKLRGVQRFETARNMAGDLNSIVVSLSFRVANPAIPEEE